jgi:catalase
MIPEEMTSGCPMANLNDVSQKVIAYIRGILTKKYGNQPHKAFHKKTIGLVEAKLVVEENLPEELQVGLFQKDRTYNAWIRFSNASPGIKKDKGRSVRGMAIKVLQADGQSGPDKNDTGPVQDIILSTSKIFGSPTAAHQLNAVKLVLGNFIEKIISFLVIIFTTPLNALAFFRSFINTPNVLEEMYYSGTPYRYGETNAIKWHVQPLKTITSSMPRKPTRDFLRDRLIKDLKYPKEPIAFALFVQFQENKDKEPIDDATVIWKTKFIRVGTITLPKQDIDTDDRHKKDKQMSFSPGNALPEHAPLGSINMVRKKVYEQLARERIKEQPALQPEHQEKPAGVSP